MVMLVPSCMALSKPLHVIFWKTEFLLQDVRKGRSCGIVIVDEVDSMLIDQGVQCTYLSHDLASTRDESLSNQYWL